MVSKAAVKCSNDNLVCVSSPEKIRSFGPGPKIASSAFRSSALAASASALPASSGEANVFWAASVAAGFSEAGFSDLVHEARNTDSARSASSIPQLEKTNLAISDYLQHTRSPSKNPPQRHRGTERKS